MSQSGDGIVDEEFALSKLVMDYMEEYSIYVSEDRSIPSIVDGLKPSQRRLIFTAVNDMRQKPTDKTSKIAKLVGRTMGDYHPHGDAGLTGALVNLTSSAEIRYPLFTQQGNFGDKNFGDKAAAPRYIENVINELGLALTQDVEFVPRVPNFDGTLWEPVMFVPPLPMALVMGSEGIGSGAATNLPGHTIEDVCAAAIAYIQNENCRYSTLISALNAPEYVSGGNLMDYEHNVEALTQIYTTGSGTLYYEPKWVIEKSDEGRWSHMLRVKSFCPTVDVFTFINNETLLEMVESRTIELIDLSAGSKDIDVRIYCNDLAMLADSIIPMFQDFSKSYNMTFVDYKDKEGGGLQKTIIKADVKYIISRWLSFRRTVVRSRLENKIETLSYDLEKLLVQYYLATHEIEREMMIKAPDAESLQDILLNVMMFNERQAEYAPKIQIRTIMKLNEDELLDAMAKLEANIASLTAQLGNIDGLIVSELKQLSKQFANGRKVTIYENNKLPKIVENNHLCVAKADWSLVTSISWPRGGTGFNGQLKSATQAKKLLTAVTWEGNIHQFKPYSTPNIGKDTAIAGVVSDKHQYIVALTETNGTLIVRPNYEYGKVVKANKDNIVCATGIDKKDIGVLIKFSDGSWMALDTKYLISLSMDKVSHGLEIWQSEDVMPIEVINIPAGGSLAKKVGGTLKELNLATMLSDFANTLLASTGEVFAIGGYNLVSLTTSKSALLNMDDVFSSADKITACYPLMQEL